MHKILGILLSLLAISCTKEPCVSSEPIALKQTWRDIPKLEFGDFAPKDGNYDCYKHRVDTGDIDSKLSLQLEGNQYALSLGSMGGYSVSRESWNIVKWTGDMGMWDDSYYGLLNGKTVIILRNADLDTRTTYICYERT